jgi:hypothetical protein
VHHASGVSDAIDVETPLGFRVRCIEERWRLISEMKHPVLRNLRDRVVEAIREPDEIRRSIRDRQVLVFHKRWQLRWMSAVVRVTATGGFLVTAYPADKIKAGELVWTK